MRATAFAIASLLAALAGSGADAATPPPGSIDMGGVNLTSYCSHTYGKGYGSASVGRTINWQCVPTRTGTSPRPGGGTPVSYPISMDRACLFQYRLAGVFAVALSSDPESWQCFRPGGPGIHMH